jgi:hypothetical protein
MLLPTATFTQDISGWTRPELAVTKPGAVGEIRSASFQVFGDAGATAGNPGKLK